MKQTRWLEVSRLGSRQWFAFVYLHARLWLIVSRYDLPWLWRYQRGRRTRTLYLGPFGIGVQWNPTIDQLRRGLSTEQEYA